MNSAVLAAVVAALAAVIGGLLAALSSRNVESMRVRAGLVEKAEERKLAAIEAFLLAVNAWVDWLTFIEEQPSEDQFEELNRRVKVRDESYRHLVLLASDPLYGWLATVYNPAEYAFRATYGRQVRYLQSPDDQALGQRREFGKLLRVDLIQQLRPEVAALREPLSLEAGWRGRRRVTRQRNIGPELNAGLVAPASRDSPT
jgi:hypothetical protein